MGLAQDPGGVVGEPVEHLLVAQAEVPGQLGGVPLLLGVAHGLDEHELDLQPRDLVVRKA